MDCLDSQAPLSVDFPGCACYPKHMEKPPFRDLLRHAMDVAGVTQRELSRRSGKNISTISFTLQGKTWGDKYPPLDDIEAYARALDMPVAQLRGDEPMPGLGVAEKGALYVVPRRLLTEEELYEKFGIRPYEQPRSADGLSYSAGPGAGVPGGIEYTIPRKVKGSKYLWEAPVIGECMADEIKPGEVVIYSTRLSAEIGRVMVALRDEEELIIKRLRLDGDRQVLRPNHGEDVPVDDRIRFLGRGVSVQRALL